jgi:hypothetical protein
MPSDALDDSLLAKYGITQATEDGGKCWVATSEYDVEGLSSTPFYERRTTMWLLRQLLKPRQNPMLPFAVRVREP